MFFLNRFRFKIFFLFLLCHHYAKSEGEPVKSENAENDAKSTDGEAKTADDGAASGGGDGGGITDAEFIDRYDEVINKIACDAIAQSDASAMKLNVNQYSTYEEMAKMAFWNYGNDFSTTMLEFPEDIKWKRDFVNILFDIFKASCPSQHVPHNYLNIFRELAMIYINSVDPRGTNNTGAWEEMQTIFNTCKEDITPYDLTSKELNVVGIRGQSGTMVEAVELYPPEEKVDSVFTHVDLVVDNLWWMFSHGMGKCYPKMHRPAIVAPRLKALFVRDILRPMMNRWGDPGPLQNFAPVVGNFDLNRAQRNMRFCVTAAYFRNGIAELQMVRPLKVGYHQQGAALVMNKKTGATFG